MMLMEGPPSIRFINFLVYIFNSAVFFLATYVTYCDVTKLLSHDCTAGNSNTWVPDAAAYGETIPISGQA